MEPEDLKIAFALINSYVHISLKGVDDVLKGRIYTVDPVSQNVILITKGNENKHQLNIIMRHAIQDITSVESPAEDLEPVDVISLFGNDGLSSSPYAASLEEITDWLKKNRLDFDVKDGRINVEGVSIYAPYRPEDCMASSVIVLGRIQKLLTERFKWVQSQTMLSE